MTRMACNDGENQPMTRHLWLKIINCRLCAPVIAGLAAALTGAARALLRCLCPSRSERSAVARCPRPRPRAAERVVAFYNHRGTCEQYINEGKGAIKCNSRDLV